MGSSRGRGQGWGFRSGVKVWGSRSGEGLRFGGQGRGQGCSQGRGQGQGSMSWGQGQDWWSQGLGPRSGSMLGVKVRGVVKVMVRGSMPGGFGSGGRWGEVGDEHFVPFKN